MLVHSYDGRIDDLYASIMGGSECIQNLVPNSSPSPAHEAIVASGVRAEGLRQIAPRRAGARASTMLSDDMKATLVPWTRRSV
ncbi:MAG: hypothetical protein AUI16_09100 [Alphaproteobacteria bacterium 13_2_20CM_2_64_7]|nr:MAG: hypothetical protein AUI16_09100 [Alphaproteobacteria bacterium 13_2_20CM_2_64_7]